MTVEAVARPSLVRIITVRLALTSLLAIILQLTIVVVSTYLIEDDLNRSYVTRQAHALLAGLRTHSNDVVLKEFPSSAAVCREARKFLCLPYFGGERTRLRSTQR